MQTICSNMSSRIDFTTTQNYNDGMILSYSDIIKTEGNERRARTAIKKMKYKKIAPGLYSNGKGNDSDLAIIFKRYKNVTLTMQSAFEYYDMTDVNYDKYTVAFPHGSRVVKDKKIKQYFVDASIYDVGRAKAVKNGVSFYIYDKERMLIELIRNKRKLPYDYYKEVVNSYRQLMRDDSLDFNLIVKYAKAFKNGDKIVETILEVVS